MYRRDQLSQRMSRWIFCSPLCDYYTTWSFFSAVASRKFKTELVVRQLVSPWSRTRTSIRHNYRGPPTTSSILECDRYTLCMLTFRRYSATSWAHYQLPGVRSTLGLRPTRTTSSSFAFNDDVGPNYLSSPVFTFSQLKSSWTSPSLLSNH